MSESGGTATVTITKAGGFTAAAAETRVDGLGYENTSDDPQTGARTATLTQIVDSGTTANSGTNTTTLSDASVVTLTAVSDAPTLSTTGDDPTFIEDAVSPASLFSGTSIDVIDTGDSVTSVTLTVSGLQDGAAEQLYVDGEAISLTNGASATTAANSYAVSVSESGGTATITITKAGGFTAAAAETLVDGFGYENTSEDPQGATRTATLTQIVDSGTTANGGTNTTTLSDASTVTLTAVSDAPTLSTTGDDPTFVEDAVTPLAERFAHLDEVVAPYGLDQLHHWTSQRGDEIWEADWKLIITNAMESYHLFKVHPETLEPYSPTSGAYYIAGSADGTATGGASTRGDDDYVLLSLPPNLVGVFSQGAFLWQAVFPAGPGRSRVVTGAAYRSADPAESGVVSGFLKRSASAVADAVIPDFLPEDKWICERGQRATTGTFEPGALLPVEQVVIDFHHYLARQVHGTQAPSPATSTTVGIAKVTADG